MNWCERTDITSACTNLVVPTNIVTRPEEIQTDDSENMRIMVGSYFCCKKFNDSRGRNNAFSFTSLFRLIMLSLKYT